MIRHTIQLIVLILLLTSCGEAPPTPIKANAPAEPVASVIDDDLLGIWVGSQEQPNLRFTEDGRYCLAHYRDELDTFPGDCGTFEVEDEVLSLTSDQGYCKGETGTYKFSRTTLGHWQLRAISDDCTERFSNINNITFKPSS